MFTVPVVQHKYNTENTNYYTRDFSFLEGSGTSVEGLYSCTGHFNIVAISSEV